MCGFSTFFSGDAFNRTRRISFAENVLRWELENFMVFHVFCIPALYIQLKCYLHCCYHASYLNAIVSNLRTDNSTEIARKPLQKQWCVNKTLHFKCIQQVIQADTKHDTSSSRSLHVDFFRRSHFTWSITYDRPCIAATWKDCPAASVVN